MNSYKFDIPIFPLNNVIMLPGSFLPLNIFEKRYLNMVDDALKSSSRLIGIIQPLMNKTENIEFFENSNMNGRIVYYYMNGCPACQNFNSTWEQFESQYSGNMSIEKIEQSNAGNDLSIYNIQGFPTVVKLDSQNTLVDTFNSERTVDNLLNFAS